MSTKSKRHTHKYHKVIVSGTKVWACALPDCPHYMPEHMTDLVYGKNTICWGCDEVMILNETFKKIDKPICANCSGINNFLIAEKIIGQPTEDVNASDVSMDMVKRIKDQIINPIDGPIDINHDTINDELINDEFPIEEKKSLNDMSEKEVEEYVEKLISGVNK